MPLNQKQLRNLAPEIESLLRTLEAKALPTNPNAPVNQRLKRAYQSDLEKYFKQLKASFPYNKLEGVYRKFVTEASVRKESSPLIDPLLVALNPVLEDLVVSNTTEIYLAGSNQMVGWAEGAGLAIDFEGPPMRQSIAYARKHGAKLVKQLDDTTRKQLANVIAEGIEGKRGVAGISRDIQAMFDDMAKFRADRIALTETNDALSQAFMDRAKDFKVEFKEWLVVAPCEICSGNESDGIIPLNSVFSSGHDRPPAHPNCVCALAPVVGESEGEGK